MARLDTVPGGERVRSVLRLLGFIEDQSDEKEGAGGGGGKGDAK